MSNVKWKISQIFVTLSEYLNFTYGHNSYNSQYVFCPIHIRSGLTSKIAVDLDVYFSWSQLFSRQKVFRLSFETQAEENFEIKTFPIKLIGCNKMQFINEIIKGQ